MLAALYVLSKSAGDNDKAFLATGAIIVGILSVTILCSFQFAMSRFRKRLAYLYETYFDEIEQDKLFLDAKSSHPFVTYVLILACVIGSAFTFKIIL